MTFVFANEDKTSKSEINDLLMEQIQYLKQRLI